METCKSALNVVRWPPEKSRPHSLQRMAMGQPIGNSQQNICMYIYIYVYLYILHISHLIRYQGLGTTYLVPHTCYHVSGAKYLLPCTTQVCLPLSLSLYIYVYIYIYTFPALLVMIPDIAQQIGNTNVYIYLLCIPIIYIYICIRLLCEIVHCAVRPGAESTDLPTIHNVITILDKSWTSCWSPIK